MKAIRVDFRTGMPIYLQIVEQIRQRVASGELKPNDQLPTVRQLASEFRVNFNTVARAYRILDEAGLISTQQGRGTYILEETTPEMSRNIKEQSLREVARTFIHETDQLGFSLDEVLRVLKNIGGDKTTHIELPN